jgi:hypothetical protein
MRTLIGGGDVVAYDDGGHRLLRGGALVLEDDHVLFVGRAFDGAVDRRVDATGKLVMPGLVNLHCHADVEAGLPPRGPSGSRPGSRGRELADHSANPVTARDRWGVSGPGSDRARPRRPPRVRGILYEGPGHVCRLRRSVRSGTDAPHPGRASLGPGGRGYRQHPHSRGRRAVPSPPGPALRGARRGPGQRPCVGGSTCGAPRRRMGRLLRYASTNRRSMRRSLPVRAATQSRDLGDHLDETLTVRLRVATSRPI